MLIFTRRTSEPIIIGDNIKFKILVVKGNRVRIGIDAPVEVEIMREELLEKELNK